MKKLIYLTGLLLTVITVNVMAQDQSIFTLGEKAKNVNHTGDVWLRELNAADKDINSQISLAVFAPNAKLNWHTHSAGQILLITDGAGYYQEKGKTAQLVKKGDVVKCLPGVEHWHGSTPTTGVTYLAVSPKSSTTWLQPVDEQTYLNLERTTDNALNDEEQLKALSASKWTWMADKNTDELNKLFHEKSMFVHMGGSWGKQRELDVIKSGGIWYKKAEVYSVTLNIIGNTAILLNDIDLEAVVGGNTVTNPFMVTEVYVKENGEWKMGSLTFSKLARLVKMNNAK
jgi:4-carboxymuconolactone decarboxylase